MSAVNSASAVSRLASARRPLSFLSGERSLIIASRDRDKMLRAELTDLPTFPNDLDPGTRSSALMLSSSPWMHRLS